MNDKTLQAGAESLKKIGLSAREKEAMLAHIAVLQGVPGMFPPSVKSPWKTRVAVLVSRSGALAIVATLVATLGGGFLAYASEKSLPGDLLYPLKVNISEPLQKALTFSNVGKIEFAAQIVDKRLREEETLASEGKLDRETRASIGASVSASLKDLDAAVEKTPSLSGQEKGRSLKVEAREHVDRQSRKIDGIVNPEKKSQREEGSIVPAINAPRTEEPKKDGVEAKKHIDENRSSEDHGPRLKDVLQKKR